MAKFWTQALFGIDSFFRNCIRHAAASPELDIIGILEVPASKVGLIQAVTGIPGTFVILLGGVRADETDSRTLPIRVWLFAPVFPLFLITVAQFQQLNILAVSLWALGISFCVSY